MLTFLIKIAYFIFFTYVLTKFLKWLFNYIYNLRNYSNVKGYPIIPFIGNTHQIGGRKDFLRKTAEMSRKFRDEPFFMFWRGWNPAVIYHKADHLDMLMSGSKNTEKSFEYDFIRPWLNDGLLTSHGEKWYLRRRLLTPSFHFEILNDFLLVFNEQANILVDILTKLSKEKNEIDIFERLGYCALDIICETAMGKHASTQIDGSSSEYYRSVSKIVVLIRERVFLPLYWMDLIYNMTSAGKEHNECLRKLHGFSRKIIMERSEEFENSNLYSKRIAFLDMLLKAKSENPSITFNDIQEEVDTFMFEGHDTTAAAMSFACHLIGSHPEVQKKLHEEVDRVLGTTGRDVTNEDIKNLKYLECVIKETLRLFPSVPIHGRVVSEDEKIGNYNITKGTSAAIFTYMIHRDEKYYPDPEKFDPDRFLPENSRDRHPFAYIPFSAGKRNCIGQKFALMEEKVVLANILRKFEIKSLKKTEELEPIADVILRPLYGIPVKLTLRS